MSYHIINIDTPEAYITCKRGQLVCDCGNGTIKQLPLEDVAAIVITSFSATIHSQLLCEAADLGVSIIFCKNFKPVSIMMPANRSSDTLLSKALIEIPKEKLSQYWLKTIDAKCENQYAIAKFIAPNSKKLAEIKNVCARKTPQKESQCARYYWSVFGEGILKNEFRRNDNSFSENSLLDFGYAVLESIVMQKIFALGLDASYGIGHKIRERSAPLVYDLMEPFRPYIDCAVAIWIKENPLINYLKVDIEFKRFIIEFINKKSKYLKSDFVLTSEIESSVRSFRNAVKKNDIGLYTPWTLKNSKWGGC